MASIPQFFELRRDWLEGYASLTLKRGSDIHASHLSVYEGPCGEKYLRNFRAVRFNLGYLPDLLPNNFGWYLASPRLCKVFQNAGSETKAFIQPLASMQFPEFHEAVMGYSLLSAAQVLDCLDINNPALTWFDSERTSLQKYTHLRLLKNRIPTSASFFAVKQIASMYVVSDAIYKAIVNSNYSGMAFKECELV